MRRALFAAVGASLLIACPTITRTAAPRSAPLPEHRAIAAQGEYRHEESGLVFPVSVRSLKRGEVTQFDEKAYDIAVGYDEWGSLATTVYLFPGPEHSYIGASPDAVRSSESAHRTQAMEQIKAGIVGSHPDYRLVAESASTLTAPMPGDMAAFAGQERRPLGVVAIRSEVHLFIVDHRWFLKVRSTFPEAQTAAAQAANQHLLDAILGEPERETAY